MRSNQGPDWEPVTNFSMTELSMKSGMKIFRTRLFDSVSSCLRELHLRNTSEPLYPHNLIKEEYNEVLQSHLFLKYKIQKNPSKNVV